MFGCCGVCVPVVFSPGLLAWVVPVERPAFGEPWLSDPPRVCAPAPGASFFFADDPAAFIACSVDRFCVRVFGIVGYVSVIFFDIVKTRSRAPLRRIRALFPLAVHSHQLRPR